MMLKRPIAISLSPNTTSSDVLEAVKQIITPWTYLRGNSTRFLEQWFRRFFDVSYAISFNSGRAALYSILRVLDIKKGDEVLIQAFTCVAVPNAVRATGARVVYVDIDDTLTMNPQDLKERITSYSKAIVVQHTFGIPSKMKEIMQIARENKIPVIEDAAHTIGGEYTGKKLGTIGIASIFSFGRDKAFSSVYGGMAITKNKRIGEALREYQSKQDYPSLPWIVQQLLHPIAFSIILPLYNTFSLGKIFLVILQKIHFLSIPVSEREKQGENDLHFVAKMPNALAGLALIQVKKLKQFNAHRQRLTELYQKEITSKTIKKAFNEKAPLLRFPILVKNPTKLINYFRKHTIYLGNWYSHVIDPKGTNLKSLHYEEGFCPKAEEAANSIVNLPTYPLLSEKDAAHIIKLLHAYDTD